MSSKTVAALRARLFADRPNDWQTYHGVVAAHLRPGMTVVDVGAGKGTIAPFDWGAHEGIELVGLDRDPAAEANADLDRFALLEDGEPWPLADGSADLVIARYVLEHVEDPDDFLANVSRVLKPGGRFVFLTPNRRHPTMQASRLLSHRTHRSVLRKTRQLDAGDVFATHYRMNTPADVADQARAHGLAVDRITVREFAPTGYLDFVLPGFLLALLYYWIVSLTGLDRWIGLSMVGTLSKR